jgi:hypothetical protein
MSRIIKAINLNKTLLNSISLQIKFLGIVFHKRNKNTMNGTQEQAAQVTIPLYTTHSGISPITITTQNSLKNKFSLLHSQINKALEILSDNLEAIQD